jgi:uncharacterized membrane protein
MENASKALLIAGAILIAILLIGFAMIVMNGSSKVLTSSVEKMSQQDIEIFNSTFTNYEGTKVSGANVRALISSVISNNSTYKEVDGKLVSITIDGIAYTATSADLQSNEMSAAKASINTGATYTVTMEYNSTSGLINKVVIKKN